jgi:hypothetical protein
MILVIHFENYYHASHFSNFIKIGEEWYIKQQSVLLYECKTWSLTLNGENKLEVSETK